MSNVIAKFKLKKATISARVYRASSGKWEDLGMVASTGWWENLKIKIKNFLK